MIVTFVYRSALTLQSVPTKDQYTHERPLHAASSGASSIFNVLQTSLEFKGSLRQNVTTEQMHIAVKSFAEGLPACMRLVVLFFAGHGREDQEGEQMLLGTDSNLRRPSQNILTVSSVLNTLSAATSAMNAAIVLILDCCREKADEMMHKFEELREDLQPSCVSILYACASGACVPDQVEKDILKSPFEIILTTLFEQGCPLSLGGIEMHIKLMLDCMKNHKELLKLKVSKMFMGTAELRRLNRPSDEDSDSEAWFFAKKAKWDVQQDRKSRRKKCEKELMHVQGVEHALEKLQAISVKESKSSFTMQELESILGPEGEEVEKIRDDLHSALALERQLRDDLKVAAEAAISSKDMKEYWLSKAVGYLRRRPFMEGDERNDHLRSLQDFLDQNLDIKQSSAARAARNTLEWLQSSRLQALGPAWVPKWQCLILVLWSMIEASCKFERCLWDFGQSVVDHCYDVSVQVFTKLGHILLQSALIWSALRSFTRRIRASASISELPMCSCISSCSTTDLCHDVAVQTCTKLQEFLQLAAWVLKTFVDLAAAIWLCSRCSTLRLWTNLRALGTVVAAVLVAWVLTTHVGLPLATWSSRFAMDSSPPATALPPQSSCWRCFTLPICVCLLGTMLVVLVSEVPKNARTFGADLRHNMAATTGRILRHLLQFAAWVLLKTCWVLLKTCPRLGAAVLSVLHCLTMKVWTKLQLLGSAVASAMYEVLLHMTKIVRAMVEDVISPTRFAFEAKKTDGTVVSWGDASCGRDSSNVRGQLTDVGMIYSNEGAFAAKKTDGTVVTWGSPSYGGDSSSVRGQLTDVDVIYSTHFAFAAKKTDGTVVTWGDPSDGGDSSSVSGQLTDVDVIYSTRFAFAAKTHGTVVTWGSPAYGGDSSSVRGQLTDVDVIYSTHFAFAAKKADGAVVTWGFPSHGGDSGSVRGQLTDVDMIYSNEGAFAAKKTDGTVVTWGSLSYGGDSSSVRGQLTDVDVIYSTHFAFAAKKTDGTMVTWGFASRGGVSSSVSGQLTDVDVIYSTRFAFAAKKTDGSVVTWGLHPYGGDSSSVRGRLTDVDMIYSTEGAFAAGDLGFSCVRWRLQQCEWPVDRCGRDLLHSLRLRRQEDRRHRGDLGFSFARRSLQQHELPVDRCGRDLLYSLRLHRQEDRRHRDDLG